ncbi:hypothetical protein [Micromonospora sp. CPCC 205556]|uniref:hypothetical protein n=1 Tax=Micromonospora sp. CPCC 205556 TaxID=3122398 RepID=UPI002FF3872A
MISLVVAAVGVVTMVLAGVEFTTTIPPGLVILLVPAGLVAFGRWPWTLVVATLASLFIFVGHFPSGTIRDLLDPIPFGAFLGLWLQFLASLVAVISGLVACVQNYRTTPKTERPTA